MVCLQTKPAGVYRSRKPLESDFHSLIRERFDDFRAAYPERYARKYGYWRPVFDKAVREFLKCGDLRAGFARVRCPDCRHEFFVGFSCKQRCICPSCSQKRTVLFGAHVAEDVCLGVPHRQFVWTIPKRIRVFFRFHRGLLRQLPILAWQSLLEAYRAILGDDATPGGILAVQTFGQLIHFHPHIHGLITDGAFDRDGRFLPLPVNLGHEPFLRLWEDKVFSLLLRENKIKPDMVAQVRSWRHTGFGVDRSVRLDAGDQPGIERLAQYMGRSPFSLARLVRITPAGQVVYRAEKDNPQRFPDPASEDLLGGVARNFQVFEPLDFLAELTQHIPNKGEHLIRYYGHYSNKARGMRARKNLPAAESESPASEKDKPTGPIAEYNRRERRRWAMLIKRVYQTDPLMCPRCGGVMQIIAFIEARQGDVIRGILEHCGLWEDPVRGPPCLPFRPTAPQAGTDSGVTYLPDPEFQEFIHRERQEQSAKERPVERTYEADPDFLDYQRRDRLADSSTQLSLPWDD